MRESIRSRTLKHVAALVGALLVLIPAWWALIASLRGLNDVFAYTYPFSWRALAPVDLTLAPYISALSEGFGRAILNSIIVSGGTVVVGLAVNGAAGYAFARYSFKGNNALFVLVVATFLLPFEATALPLYELFSGIGLVDSYAALILPAIPNGLLVFLFRQFFREIPIDLHEAATLDGANTLQTLFRIYLPLSIPVMVSAALTMFVTQWESFLWPLLVTRSNELAVVQIALGRFQGQHATEWNTLLAAGMLSCLVPLLLFLPLQRYYRLVRLDSGTTG